MSLAGAGTLPRILIALGAAQIAIAPTFGQDSVLDEPFVRNRAKEGLDLLYDMRFEEAASLFSSIGERYPAHPIGPLLAALNTWWQILLDFSNTEHDEAFYAAMTDVVDRCTEILEADPGDFDAMFFKGVALGFRGRLRSNRRDWLRAAADGKRAMDYVLEVARQRPESHDYAFGQGLYRYYAAVIPDRYPVVRPLLAFLPRGDRVEGLASLERTATFGHYFRSEATYFLLQIYYLYESDYARSLEYVGRLRDTHPGNSFFHTLEGRIHARWGDWARSAAVFDDVLDLFKSGAPGYTPAMAEQALYYMARSHMEDGRYTEALTLLLQLEALSARLPQDTYFKVMGRLNQGMAYDATGRRDLAQNRYEQVLAMQEWGSSQRQARRFLRTPFDPRTGN